MKTLVSTRGETTTFVSAPPRRSAALNSGLVLAFGAGLLFACAAVGIIVATTHTVRRAATAPSRSSEPAPESPGEPPDPSPSPRTPLEPAVVLAAPSASPAPTESPFESSAEIQSFLAGLVDGETQDRAWAPAAEHQLTDTFQAILPETAHVDRLECKSTLCRVDFAYSTPRDQGSFVASYLMRRPWHGPLHVTAPLNDGTGKITRTAYVAREGHELPGITN